MNNYSVKSLANLAWVSIRTLHHYDEIGLLQPSQRTKSGYRLYNEQDLFKLQQILFYKELDFSLQEIWKIIEHPKFNLIEALQNHKKALKDKKSRIDTLIVTIDNTILQLKWKKMLSHEDLYKWLPKEKAESYRQEAIEKYWKEAVEKSENSLRSMDKDSFENLKNESSEIWLNLFSMKENDPKSQEVQEMIARHYKIILQFWWKKENENLGETYKWLGQLYIDDPRFTMMNDKPNPEFAVFLKDAMTYYVDNNLKS